MKSPVTLNKAIALHRLGSLEEASHLYAALLKQDPDDFNALHMSGVLACQRKQLYLGIDFFYKAIKANPGSSACYTNLGKALQDFGKITEAIASYERALDLDPASAQAHNNFANALIETQKYEEAIRHAQQASRLQPHNAEAFNNMAAALYNLGKYSEAETAFRQACRLKPDWAEPHENLANALNALGKLEEAILPLQRAVELKTDSYRLLNQLGNTFDTLGRATDAKKCFKRALTIKPDFAHAIGNLASLYEKENRLQDALKTALEALTHDPLTPSANLVVAACKRRGGNFHEALEYLARIDRKSCPPPTEAQVLYQEASVHDRLGHYPEAFRLYSQANSIISDGVIARNHSKRQYLDKIKYLTKWFREASPRHPKPSSTSAHEDEIVFLVGFPRSGTTLVEQILATQTHIRTIEEKPLLNVMTECLNRHGLKYPNDLFQAESSVIEDMRKAYFTKAKEYIPFVRNGIIVDKLPLNIANIGLIYRVFPEAKILVALRHPCDVCLSCFMQNFQLNESMVHFLDLHDTANLYHSVMTLWQLYAEKLSINYSFVRYEDLVTRFDETTRNLFDFIQIPWNTSVHGYHLKKRSKKRIRTPSYHQVSEPLYSRSMYRWKHYEKHLSPILPVLEPHAQRFGYPM